MAIYSSILAWRIPWTEEPGRLHTVQGVAKSWTWLSDFQFYFQVVLIVKNPPANAGDTDSIPGSERFPSGRHGNPLQFSSLENPMDRGAWQATYSPWGHKASDTTERLSHTEF